MNTRARRYKYRRLLVKPHLKTVKLCPLPAHIEAHVQVTPIHPPNSSVVVIQPA
jgi:hypothetical protein